MPRRWAWTELLAALVAAAAIACSAAPPGVDDGAALLDAEQREQIEEHHGYLLRDHGVDYRVVTGRDLGELAEWTNRRFAQLDVGAASPAGHGLLLVIDAGQDAVRLEVSRSLEGAFPDAFIAYLEHRQMLPFFRASRVGHGILASTELVVARIQNAKAKAGWETEAWVLGSGGGGAQTAARIGDGPEEAPPAGPDVLGTESPEAAVDAYLEAMAARNGDPNLDLYSQGTRAFLARWVVTPAQMDGVARAYRRCHPEAVRVDESGERAVLRYPVDERACAPWFLVHEDGLWRLDLASASELIRFGRDNSWHFGAPGGEHPYAFAFDDWRVDPRGYPVGPKPLAKVNSG